MLKPLGLAQRIVLVIALALVLGTLGMYIVALGTRSAYFGWFGYAPLTRGINIVGGPDLAPWQQLLVWIGLIGVWAAVSMLVLKRSQGAEGRADVTE